MLVLLGIYTSKVEASQRHGAASEVSVLGGSDNDQGANRVREEASLILGLTNRRNTNWVKHFNVTVVGGHHSRDVNSFTQVGRGRVT